MRGLVAVGLFSLAVVFSACHEEADNYSNKDLTLDAFSAMKTPSISIDPQVIRKHLTHIVNKDTGRFSVDRRIREYYRQGMPLLWADRLGVDHRADSLLVYIEKVGETGIMPQMYRVEEIRDDLNRLRSLELTEKEDINRVMARLEYNLTRAYLRYASFQRFGYVNPNYTLNRCVVKDSDSMRVTYHHVYDVKNGRPDDAYFQTAYAKLHHDSVATFLREIQPDGKLYRKLMDKLRDNQLSYSERLKVICNIEKCRWQHSDIPDREKKYVVVNIPSFTLYGYDGDSLMTMKIGCGKLTTRTPLIHSYLKRMEINPQWIVPKSIAKTITGSIGYLHRNNMFVVERGVGKLPAERASYEKVMSGKQYIVQAGGEGNSLGRIIFRFDNNFSVYLHHTNTPWVFERSVRTVSHGCVRVEKPYDLAVFLLDEKDEKLMERIKYSMTANLNPKTKEGEEAEKIDRSKLVSVVKVEPEIPVFIDYFTCYPASDGQFRFYNDVYGYDAAILKAMKNYIQ